MGGGGGGGGGGGSHWYAGDDRRSTTQQAGSHLETYSEKLTVLSSRILRSARLVACPSSPTLTVTSPHVEGLFEATRTLITVVDGLGQYYATSKAGPPKRGSIPEQSSAGSGMGPYEWDSTADRGVVFLVLVCQQRLLGVFEAMCLSIRERLHSAPAVGFVPDPSLSPSLNHRAAPVGAQSPAKEVGTRTRTRTRTRKRTLRTTTATIWQPSLVPALHDGDTPSLAQSAMVLQLLSHLLNRLDRAFDPLAEDAVAGSPSKRSRSATLADSDEDASHHDPGHVGPESVDERQQRLSKAGEVVQEDFTTRPLTRRASTPPPPARGSRGMLHVARGLLDGVKTQHTSLRRDIEGLQRYIEQSRGL
ncbi:hypothetical protein LZ30DRAFT_736043 [Colletotrichum cereale]|nr:hypothetical protein LZ30DRAFT_736043 [Colletotrichum cereale]